MKIAVITDTHLDARQSSPIFLSHMKEYYENIFFPFLEKNGIDVIIHAGDFTDNRQHISHAANRFMFQSFGKALKEKQMKMFLCLGNHDLAFRNTSEIHSLTGLESAFPDNIEIIAGQKMVELDGQKFMLCGWLNKETFPSYKRMSDTYSSKNDTILVGHFEFAGAKHYKNSSPTEHGLNQDEYQDWQDVWSGHFHHKNRTGKVLYLGSLFYLNWQDHNDERGFHVFDTETKELEYVLNPLSLFYEYRYTEGKEPDYSLFKNKFVRIIKPTIESDAKFMEFVCKAQQSNPIKLDCIDNSVAVEYNDVVDIETQESHVKELSEYFEEYLEAVFPGRQDKTEVSRLLADLMKEAEELQMKGEI